MHNEVWIGPSPLGGALRILPSKSASHRALICAALAPGHSEVSPLQGSEDIEATLRCLLSLGLLREAKQTMLPGGDGFFTCAVFGGGVGKRGEVRGLHCGESGSTLRFLIPLALDGRGPVVFRGAGRLMERPLLPYQKLFEARGLRWQQERHSLIVEGKLTPGDYALPGNVSSQFLTGLLFALPRLCGDSTLRLTSPLESRGYVDMTLEALSLAGVYASMINPREIIVPGNQTYRPGGFAVPGDWSHAAFFLVGGLLGRGVALGGLSPREAQGDRAVVDILRRMGGQIEWKDGVLHAAPGPLAGTEIDVRDVPDLVPALCIAACAARGETRITGAGRLRLKESDRLHAMTEELTKLGARVTEQAEGLVIQGGIPLGHGVVEGHQDHRIAMALAIAAPLCAGGVTLMGAQAVAKSAPRFFAELQQLGGEVHERQLGR